MQNKYKEEIIKRANPLKNADDLTPLIDSIKHKKIVMLGESSHGTKEFYQWRSEITKELIANHGFNLLAIEGDWPPSQEINRYIHSENLNANQKHLAEETLSHFSRWPTWMWANDEMVGLIQWLKTFNELKFKPISFYGLDVYSLYESIDQVIYQLSKIDSEYARQAIAYYSCFDKYRHDEKAYARSLFHLPEGCKQKVLSALNQILEYKMKKISDENNQLFDIEQNAKIVCNADDYYRAMVLGEDDSWNVRDNHMMETLNSILAHHEPDAKVIIWEHNTHIGDYRATDMLQHGQVNIGGLARKQFGNDNVALVGFTTYSGSVIASSAWDGPIMIMPVPEGKPGSLEAELHNAAQAIGYPNYFLLLNEVSEYSPLFEVRGHRAIGVVYHPPSERHGNYVPTSLSKRYDVLVFIDKTEAINPLVVRMDPEKIPETYPYGAHL